MASSGTVCHACGRTLSPADPVVRAFGRLVTGSESEATPDLRGPEAIFDQACAPDWGDPEWISRTEATLEAVIADAEGLLMVPDTTSERT